MNRRQFLAATGMALASPMILTSCAGSRPNRPPPSGRITMGIVGWGMQGPGNTKAFLEQRDCQVVAACDVDQNHLKQAVDTINEHYGNKDCIAYHDYREMLARNDIDAVMLAVPDTWHALIAIEAARQGKDIYGEKPLARTIAEQQAIVKAVHKHGRIWQTGSWQRSQRPFRQAAEIVRNGLIGKVTRVEVGLPGGNHDWNGTGSLTTPTTPPPELDYDFWLGPSHMEPYIPARIHMNWRWNYNVGGGQLMDWIGHHNDIAHWGMGFDLSGPLEVEGTGEFPPKDAVWNTATKYRINCKYPGDVDWVIAGGYPEIKMGAKWIGTDGWVYVDRNRYDASNLDWFVEIPQDRYRIKLYHSDNHQRNFLDCVKSRQPTITPAEVAHHSAITGHLGLISMIVGRKLKWNSAHEKIIGDHEASKMLSRPYRAPWKLA